MTHDKKKVGEKIGTVEDWVAHCEEHQLCVAQIISDSDHPIDAGFFGSMFLVALSSLFEAGYDKEQLDEFFHYVMQRLDKGHLTKVEPMPAWAQTTDTEVKH